MENVGGETRLDQVPNGETVEIMGLDSARHVSGRLAALGFVPGATVHIIQNYSYAPLIVSVAQARVAVGRGEAGNIRARRLA